MAASNSSATAPSSTSSTSTSSGPTVKQAWTVTIASTGTGAVDPDDDGRRLRLTLLDAHGQALFVGSTDDSAAPWAAPVIDKVKKGWSRTGVVSVEVPAGVTPAVLKVEKMDREKSDTDGKGGNGKSDKERELEERKRAAGAVDYIYSVSVSSKTPGAAFSTEFAGQEWIASRKAPGSRPETAAKVLFAATSLPQDTTDFLRQLRAIELLKIRGEVSVDPAVNAELQLEKRQAAENVYDYQTYNDLGSKKMPRPTLGGAQYPYPRRLATHLATEGGTEQIDPEPWLPYNERFTFSKKTDFTSGTVSAAVPAIFTGLGHVADVLFNPLATLKKLPAAIKEVGPNPLKWVRELAGNYSSFEDVAQHYSYDALPNPLDPSLTTPPEDPVVGSSAATIASAGASGDDSSDSSSDEDDLREMNSWLNRRERRRGPFQQDFEDNAPPQPNAGKVAVSTLLGMASGALVGNLKPQMKMPRVLVDRPADVCFQDEEFGRQFLAGFNPSVISALTQMPAELGSAITEADVAGDLDGASMASLVAAAKAGQKPRLFWVDYWAYTAFFTQDWTDDKKVLHAGRALLFLKQDKSGNDTALIPVALELAAHPNCVTPPEPTPKTAPTSGTVYSRSKLLASEGGKNVWDVAKLVFRSLDVGVHQLISHWLRCHAAIEPFLIALKRCVSSAHPVYRLLLPHFRYTMSINAAARGGLINADGVIEKTFAPGEFAMRLSSVIYGATWRFESQALPVDLKQRGMVDASTGKLHLRYPYAEDGMRIWSSLEKYFSSYLDVYYGSGEAGDARVVADTEVQAWWTEVTTKAHPDLPDKTHWGVKDPAQLSSRQELTRVLVTIAWTASAHHAAVNFGQYDFTSFPLNAPSLIRRPVPRKPSDKSWQELAKASGSKYEEQVLSYVNGPTTNLLVALTVNLLSTHAQDEHLIDEANTLLTDAAARALNDQFIAEMTQLESDILADHRPDNWTRAQPGTGSQATYSTCLVPGSVAGLTMRGVPYSVSI